MNRRSPRPASLVTCLLSCAGLLALAPPTPAQAQPDRGLDLYFVDVMGGAATLIITPDKQSILIDCGWPGFEGRDPGRILHVLRDVAGCERIDHLVITHWHLDHWGGVGELASAVEIGHFWDRGLPEDNIAGLDFPDLKPGDPLLAAYRAAAAGKRTVLHPGDRLPIAGLENLVLASGGRLLDPPADAPANPLCSDAPPDRPTDNSDNARSIVFRFEFGPFRFFDAGDLTWNLERDLVCPVNRIGPIDLYQVTHHGMDISNNPVLVRSIQPTVAVMNNGPRKGGSAATVHLLRSLPSLRALYALHANQATGPDDNADPAYTANRDPAGGQFVHAHVEPDGKSYWLQIGADGARQTFQTK